MPHRPCVREIIPSRVGRAVSPAALTPSPPTPRSTFAAAAYLSPLQGDVRRCNTLYGDTFRHMRRGNSWWIQATKSKHFYTPQLPLPGARRCPTVLNGSQSCLKVPGRYRVLPSLRPLRLPSGNWTLSGWGDTGNPSNGRQCGPEGVLAGAKSSRADTLAPGRIGDSEGWGLTRCQCLTALPPTCDRKNSPTSCTSPPAPCAGGAGKEKARISSGTAESFDLAATRLTLGLGRVTDFRALRKGRCGGPPRPGRTAASVKVRREHRPLSTRCYPTTPSLQEASVTPTLKLEPLLRATPPGVRLNTSPLISVGPVIP
jgi:hypothetical protein